ncbi:hypothetical protein GCM10022243_04350 [Saccharothrix violaceirubra]|uniref:Uncharacterized protein n=1 Tax=Saccharothrix violaceirubra TaxID=413306 RepID=A0A7W7SXN0_9PSEU|nr:DUF6232 family protein [Saccharothrix violaceirubra]MBB4962844.1 hypothetical protein [Saccharothrix violaceirubra]
MARDVIDIAVRNRILWIGSRAYPLPNITMADLKEVRYRRSTALWEWSKAVAWCAAFVLVMGFIGASTTIGVGNGSYSLGELGGLVAVVIGLGVTVRLLVKLLSRPLYRLVLQTAAGSADALASRDGAAMRELTTSIVDAINDPHASFQRTINNVINQYGAGAVATQNNLGGDR